MIFKILPAHDLTLLSYVGLDYVGSYHGLEANYYWFVTTAKSGS